METPAHYQKRSTKGERYLLLLDMNESPCDMDVVEYACEYRQILFKDAILFNIVKYLWRLDQKGDGLEDISKAHHYCVIWMSCAHTYLDRYVYEILCPRISELMTALKEDYGLSE